MTDTEIIEAYFKARGWKPHEERWKTPSGEWRFLPSILFTYPAFKEHVLEVMGEEGFSFVTHTFYNVAEWRDLGNDEMLKHADTIKSNNILHAAVIAATRYFEGKK